MAQAQTKSSFMPFGLLEFEDACTNCKMCFLKINRLLKLKKLISNFFLSVIIDGEKGVFKKALLMC